jgi:hypothetical protein
MPITFKQGMTAQLYDAATGDLRGSLGLQGQLNYQPTLLGQGGVPVAVANSGTIATNGAITLGTALPRIYPAIWLYFPASAVVGDATGGLYYCVMSSTTVGVVYAGKQGVANGVGAVSFQPTVPATLVAVTGSNAGYTGSTTETFLVNVAIPAAGMGLNGSIRVTVNETTNNSAGAKTFKTYLGASQIAQSGSYTTSTGGTQQIQVRNAGTQAFNSSQVVGGTATGAAVYTAVDTSVVSFIALSGQLATATDNVIVEGYTIELFPKD